MDNLEYLKELEKSIQKNIRKNYGDLFARLLINMN